MYLQYIDVFMYKYDVYVYTSCKHLTIIYVYVYLVAPSLGKSEDQIRYVQYSLGCPPSQK